LLANSLWCSRELSPHRRRIQPLNRKSTTSARLREPSPTDHECGLRDYDYLIADGKVPEFERSPCVAWSKASGFSKSSGDKERSSHPARACDPFQPVTRLPQFGARNCSAKRLLATAEVDDRLAAFLDVVVANQIVRIAGAERYAVVAGAD
jgi:hypothetical protein